MAEDVGSARKYEYELPDRRGHIAPCDAVTTPKGMSPMRTSAGRPEISTSRKVACSSSRLALHVAACLL